MWFGHAWRKLVEALVRSVNWMEERQIIRVRERSWTTISQIIKRDLNLNGL